MSDKLPGYPITATEPASGMKALFCTASGRWCLGEVHNQSRETLMLIGFRWAHLPGESPVERVLALGHDITSRMSAIGVRRWWVDQSDGATPDDAARAALAAKVVK
uniref:Uncharacterized protein n=1 Tax=viral metagenome TaxID=1070528 RepID=A0A6H1Z7W9_9ZZZZ